MSESITFIDNSAKVLEAMKSAKARALEKVGLVAEGYAKKLCPVDTGNLRNSISHDSDSDYVYIGTNVDYAPHVEVGTRKQRAQPFLRPAASDHKATYRQIIKAEMHGG